MRDRRPSPRALRWFRSGAWLGGAALGLELVMGFAAPAARAERAPEIRVLLAQTGEAVEIEGPARTHRALLDGDAGGLRIDRQRVGGPWLAPGEGPWRVAGRRYRGRLELRREAGALVVVNHVALEDYVAATVGGEMPSSWPVEALRAQAVATRTYALHQRDRQRAKAWDVHATVQSQVYRGIESETKATRSAADATRGEILTFAGRPILAAFHSTAGGQTASAAEVWGERVPYLESIEVQDEEDAPHTYWRTVVRPETLTELFDELGARAGRIRSVEVDARTPSGRVDRLIVEGGRRRIFVTGDPLRTLVETLGLRSRLFDVRETPEGFAFVGSGHGHGVGMSQWAAREWARRGAPYQRILARFYPGARLEQWRGERVASRAESGKRGR